MKRCPICNSKKIIQSDLGLKCRQCGYKNLREDKK
jgi:DNA-directed RNA polymerase subunit RPC12/RpoP